MHGDFAQLAAIAELTEQFGAIFMVDEAHATGVFGSYGCGRCDEEGVEPHVHVRIGTLSKALGSHGGFVAGSRQLIDWLANRARPYFFSTAAPPAATAAALAALSLIQQDAWPGEKLVKLSDALRERLNERGLRTANSLSQIIPIVLGDADRTMAAAAELRRRGFFVPGIRPPSVPDGQSLLRISLTCLHTQELLDALVAALCEVAR
jgi:8-amino-7-oxononanoate synthase